VLLVDAEIVSPNALGGVLTRADDPELRAEIVCGGANNQLVEVEDAARLHETAGSSTPPTTWSTPAG
jgi:glutamate dehydrogenase/leucine dehydrogenase